MKHVIYYTEYYDRLGNFLRKEECDAFFFTLPDDTEALDIAAQPPIGCRLLLPKLLEDKVSEGDWRAFAAKKPDYQLKYASQYDVGDGVAIYSVYERLFEENEPHEPYSVHVSIGDGEDLTLDMCVVPLDYDLGDIHVTRWAKVTQEEDVFMASKGIDVVASSNPANDKEVHIYYGDWAIRGRWYSMEQIAPFEFVYHCRNSLCRFDVIFNIERYTWDGNYESLLHD